MRSPNQRNMGYFLIAIGLVSLVLLFLLKTSVDAQGAYTCAFIEADPSQTMAECPAHNNNNSAYFSFLFVFSALVAASGFSLAFFPVKQAQRKPNLSKLSDDEKLVYEAVKEKDGSMMQSELVKVTGFSKVKVTRLLDSLEQNQLIERKRRGMTNLVILK